MSDQPHLTDDELAKLLAESESDDQTPEAPPAPAQEEKQADDEGGGDREMTQAEIDALLASLGDD